MHCWIHSHSIDSLWDCGIPLSSSKRVWSRGVLSGTSKTEAWELCHTAGYFISGSCCQFWFPKYFVFNMSISYFYHASPILFSGHSRPTKPSSLENFVVDLECYMLLVLISPWNFHRKLLTRPVDNVILEILVAAVAESRVCSMLCWYMVAPQNIM